MTATGDDAFTRPAARHRSETMEAVGQLTSSAAHSFNTLLAVIASKLG